ncbi:MAG: hypothetical protein ACYC2G_11460 [Gemmatimonadaceae bacterium]
MHLIRPVLSCMIASFGVLLAVGCASEEQLRSPGGGVDSGRVVSEASIDVDTASHPATADVTDQATHVIFGCLEGDSAVYAGPSEDAAGGGVPDVRITLWPAGDAMDGSVMVGAGMGGESSPLAGIRLVGNDSIALTIADGPSATDTSAFTGRVACDSLWGGQRGHRQAQSRQITYRRVR